MSRFIILPIYYSADLLFCRFIIKNARYAESKHDTLQLLSTGTKGIGEMHNALRAEAGKKVIYGLFRVVEAFDSTARRTVKFGYGQTHQTISNSPFNSPTGGLVRLLSLRNDSLDPMFKAKLATHKGFVNKLFASFHVQIQVGRKIINIFLFCREFLSVFRWR
jgi:hypothetical protein